MPIKWTSENDQILLLKILETHEMTVDTRKVAEAWPQGDPNAIPTPRAITERLHKIKKTAKESIKGIAGGTPKKATLVKNKTPNSAGPRKRSANASGTPVKRIKKEPDLDIQSSPLAGHGHAGNGEGNELVKMEDSDATVGTSLGGIDYACPSKRVRIAPRMRVGFVAYDDDEDTDRDAKYETEGSEYLDCVKPDEYA
ncbi:predicted protein [Uncinocarpus reesii 1704]|uniref:Uncharacterized protein n=1 Tax=Uncinocarpus reesii (strain UAMH 1704) TaxID=336963 RepID=C4JMS2_UNCRE|nr:uncharacterized protein UREG_04130 [Uncinocarpus reesii 1704]EEP79284.1 predicted protein [Uncinocarpus reesii 1704]